MYSAHFYSEEQLKKIIEKRQEEEREDLLKLRKLSATLYSLEDKREEVENEMRKIERSSRQVVSTKLVQIKQMFQNSCYKLIVTCPVLFKFFNKSCFQIKIFVVCKL